MKRFLLLLLLTLLPAAANAKCKAMGNMVSCDNGLTGQKIGNNIYWSDGSSDQKIGKNVYRSQGSNSSRISSDGTPIKKIGNTYYNKTDGTTCQTIGARVICQ